MKTTPNQNPPLSGFTLVEVVVYTAVFSLFFTAAVSYMLLLSDVGEKRRVRSEALYAGDRIEFYIDRRVAAADNILSPQSGQTSDILSLDGANGREDILVIDGSLVSSSSAGMLALHQDRVECRDFRVTAVRGPFSAVDYQADLYIGNNASYGDGLAVHAVAAKME